MHPSSTWFVVGGRLLLTLGYQLMRTLLFMQLTQLAGLSSDQTRMVTQGFWIASIVGQPLGGLVADRVLGAKTTAGVGGGLLALGLGLLMVQQLPMLYAGLALVTLGEMLIRPNAYVALGAGYSQHEHTRVAGFAIDLGAVNVAYLISGVMGGMFMSSFGFSMAMVPALVVCAGGAALMFFAPVATPPPPPPEVPESPARIPLLAASAAVVGLYVLVNGATDAALWSRLAPGSGFMFNLNPILAIIGAVSMAVYWSSGMRSNYGESLGMWFAIGLSLLGVAGLAAALLPNEDGGSVGFLLVTVLNTVADLFVLPLAYAVATAAAPRHWKSTLFGAWSAVAVLSWLGRLGVTSVSGGEAGPAAGPSFAAAGAALLALGGAAACFAMRGWFNELALQSFAGDEQRQPEGTAPQAAPQPESATTDLIVGAITLMLGIGVTAASFAAAGGGGRYFVTTGLIIFGLFRLGRGLTRLGK